MMLLRLRVALPDRPGTLGQVARTLGVAGADIVQVVVLERVAGRAVDDFTVVWPASAPVDRILAALTAVAGVRVDGAWRGTEPPGPGGREGILVGQVAANPAAGIATLTDGAPALLSGDWATAVAVGTDWTANQGGPAGAGRPPVTVLTRSWRAPETPPTAEITPLRPRAATASDGTHLAIAPFQSGGLVLVVARGGPGGDRGAPPFHRYEVDLLGQVVQAVAAVLGDRLTRSDLIRPEEAGGEPAATTSRVGEPVG